MPCVRGAPPMTTAVLGRQPRDRGGVVRGRRCLGWCRVQRRADVLHEPHPLRGQTDRLMAAMPRLVVHDGTTHRGHPRDGGQFHQPFQLECALDPFRHGFPDPRASISAS